MMTLIHGLQRRLFGRGPSWPQAGSPDASAFAGRLLGGESQSGQIGPEPVIRVPFRLERGDGEVQMAICADPPGLLMLAFEKPDGSRLLPAEAARCGLQAMQIGATTCCGLRLPDGALAGTWHLVLAVDTGRFKAYLIGVRQRFPREFARLAAHGVHYSVSVQAARRARPAETANCGEPGSPWAAAHPAL